MKNIIIKNGKKIDNFIIRIEGYILNLKDLERILAIDYEIEVEKILLELYKKCGKSFVKRLKGSFAIFIYDIENDTLLLARDEIGIKQIYYYIDSKTFIAGITLKEILECKEFKKKLNKKVISEYFVYSYIKAPNTIYENTYKLENGIVLTMKKGNIIKDEYYSCIEKFNKLSKKKVRNLNKIENELYTLIYQSIKERIPKNGEVVVYLSGGIDSVLITTILAKIKKEENIIKNIRTYSIGFENKERNEAKNSKVIAKYLDTDHKEIYLKNECLEYINKIPSYYEEPFADSSIIPTIILNEMARKEKESVVFTGDGSDQIFAGSQIYRKEYILQRFFLLFTLITKIGGRKIFSKEIPYIGIKEKHKVQYDFKKKIKITEELLSDFEFDYYKEDEKIHTKKWATKRLIFDLANFVPNRIFMKMGYIAAKNNIEIVCPLIDSKIIEYSFRIPEKYKIKLLNQKIVLKKILYKMLPEELLNKNKKGFGIPMQVWMQTTLYQYLEKMCNKYKIEKQGIFNFEQIEKIKAEAEQGDRTALEIVWRLLIFQIWYENYIGGK